MHTSTLGATIGNGVHGRRANAITLRRVSLPKTSFATAAGRRSARCTHSDELLPVRYSYMIDCIRSHRGGMFCGVGIVDSSAASPDRTMKDLAGRGVRGFRIVPGSSLRHSLESNGMKVMWITAAKRRLAICPLIGPDALPSVPSHVSSAPRKHRLVQTEIFATRT
jgi:hypothetical protein